MKNGARGSFPGGSRGSLVGALTLGAAVLVGGCSAKQRARLWSSFTDRAPARATTSADAPRPASSAGPAEAGASAELLAGYAIGRPDVRLELPEALAEISGLTDISETEIAFVQDEQGVVFFYDLTKQAITRRLRFAGDGDFEGLTRVGRDLYVLRSDGTVYEIRDYGAREPEVNARDAGMPTKDNEGLCFDPIASRILVSSKSRPGKSAGEQRTQALFTYDPRTGRVAAEPSFTLDVDAVYDGRPREKETKRGKRRVMPTRFLPSSVAVHPGTGELFVVSAVARNLVIFDRRGQLKGQFPLDPELFPKPEGLTFLPSGELVIASEGPQRGRLLRFRPRA